MTANNITGLLRSWRSGDVSALEELAAVVQKELRRLAAQQFRRERRGHTLQPTALVNEAFIRLIDQDVEWQDRNHFFAVASRLMRQTLVDHARRRLAAKRGSDGRRITLTDSFGLSAIPDLDVLALEQALQSLASLDARQCQVVELKFFGGLSNREVGEALSISERTVRRDWSLARAYLYDLLKGP